jgi:hypothetical protein
LAISSLPRRTGRGLGRQTLDLIATCAEILEEIQPATVRAVCYRLFAAGAIPDMGTGSTQKVSRQLTWARENGHIPWDWIVDEQRAVDRVASWNDPVSFMHAVKRSYRKDLWRDQSELVEVWSEKGTVGGILGPVLDQYGVVFRVMKGFGSATSVHGAAEESQARDFTVLYVGDFDCSGMYMSEVDLPERLERYEASIDLVRIALVEEDLFGLPYFDAATKHKDPRYKWYVSRYGDRAWELDAMSPVDLRRRVENEISDFIDWDAWELARKAEAAEIATIDTVCNNWQKLIGAGG